MSLVTPPVRAGYSVIAFAVIGTVMNVVSAARSGVAAPSHGRAALAPGHVHNLGHGVPPGTDPDVLTRIVELAHGLG